MGESRLLNRGLKYVPTNFSEPFDTFKDIHIFKRQLKLRDYFKDKTPKNVSPFRTKSLYEPPNTAHTISTFTNLLAKDSMKLHYNKKRSYSNLTRIEREAIKTLKSDKDLIIRQADKGGAVVLLDKAYYEKEIFGQLSDTKTYQRLKSDPTEKFKKKLDLEIDMGVQTGWITEEMGQYLRTKFPRVPFIYTLPKIHKSLSAPPGRPIISAIGSLFQPAATFIDYFLQPIVKQMTSYIKDTKHLLILLKDLEIPPDSILVTMDVTSLYTVIPHEAGVSACREALQKSHIGPPTTEFLVSLLDLILTHNYFLFKEIFYLQVAGTAMGSNVAPSFANLFMESYEEQWLLPMGANNIIFYKRYIDDLLIIWQGNENDLLSFFQSLNSLDSPIRMTLTYDRQQIHFLDITICKQGDRVVTTLFRKPTDRNSLIQAQSHHPPHMSRGVLYSQFLRVIRNNTNRDTAELQLCELAEQFEERGYPRKLIDEQLYRAKIHNQEDLLQESNKGAKTQPDLVFTTCWSDVSIQMKKAITERWEIINSDTQLPFLDKRRPLLAYRRGQNLSDMLVVKDLKDDASLKQKTWLGGPLKMGCFKCSGCLTCSGMLQGTQFTHPRTGHRFNIKHRLTCTSDHVVYMAWCPCGLYYIGKASTTYRERMNNHRSAIRLALSSGKADQPIPRHWLQQKHTVPQFRHMIIDHVPAPRRGGDRGLKLLQKESMWIFKLDTVSPRGLNETLPMTPFY